jgi:putative ABC transport system permease protein
MMKLLSKDFMILIAIALVIAGTISFYLMNKWLEDYAYRINIEWWVFALTGSVIIVIALLTLYLQVFYAAVANPVKSLRTE